MCHTTLEQINSEANDKARLRLSEQYLSPEELLTRYYRFYSNAESLIGSQNNSLKKELFKKREVEFKNALLKMKPVLTYDDVKMVLNIKISISEVTHSVDNGKCLLNIGEDGSIVGIEIFNVVMQ